MSNRLSESSSLYLGQHADNPVHWHPWDEDALAAARESGKPILLSIGYSACHWCHVMAHESFEDPDTAAVMNELFVNIKVDREERPDLDKLYQLSHQLLTGRGGGWPLTVFLEPRELTPFFAGTYFPPAPRHGMPPFREVLQRVRQWFDASPDEVGELNDNLREAIRAIQADQPAGPADGQPLARFVEQWRQQFDARHGGTGGAPKFPQAPLLATLPAVAAATGSQTLADQLDFSLDRMARGGLRDHLDGGFFRYTVDGDWTIPHFEKMLYDNAQLLPLYAEASIRRDSDWFAMVAAGIVDWMDAELGETDGGFGASMDADADGEEGGFHVWTPVEVDEVLSGDARDEAKRTFGLDRPPNFEGRAWHLVRHAEPSNPATLAEATSTLLAHRAQRVPPATDHKRLASWNALTIDGLARAGLALDHQDWIDRADRAQAFLRSHLWDGDTLWAVHDGQAAAFPAYLDDHAFALLGTLSLLEARWKTEDYEFARWLARQLLDNFQDPERGGFFFTAEGAEAPVARLKTTQDDATPSGYASAVRGLQAFGHLAGDAACAAAAQRALDLGGRELARYPLAHASLLRAHLALETPPAQVVVLGPDLAESAAWARAVRQPDAVHCYALPPDASPESGGVPGPVAAAGHREATTAIVCKGMRCLPPIGSLAALQEELENQDHHQD